MGNNAFTDTNPDNFALYVDPDEEVDYILIKEKEKDTIEVGASSTVNIAHNLGYVPFCLVFAETSAGVFRKLFSVALDGSGLWFEVNSTNLVLRNTTAGAVNFSYHIFYDKIA